MSEELIVKSEKYKFKEFEGITLISLVITIVILIILAGITINLALGQNGIFNKAKNASKEYNEAAARELLETTLAYAFIEREGNLLYNSDTFLNNILITENMMVNGDSVVVDNYVFLIDREKLKIVDSLGIAQVQIKKDIQKYLGKNTDEKYMVNALITFKSNIGIENITITNPDGTEFTIETNKTEISKDIDMEFDKEYIVRIKTIDGKTEERKIVESSKETIKNLDEFIEFRNKVNTGLTYEGKEITLEADIDLASVCGKDKGDWIPIGQSTILPFKGTFDGKNHSINNLYINNNLDNQGLFRSIQNANISNLKIEGNVTGRHSIGLLVGYITSGANISNITTTSASTVTGKAEGIGGIVGNSGNNTVISKCINYATVNGVKRVGGISGISGTISQCGNEGTIVASSGYAGGIVGSGTSQIISYCYNTGSISGNGDDSTGYSSVGGIAGVRAIVKYSYNTGTVYGRLGQAAGICGNNYSFSTTTAQYCYNTGSISNTSSSGSILGEALNSTADHCYWTSNLNCNGSRGSSTNSSKVSSNTLKGYASVFGNNFIADGKKIDENGNIVDNLDKDGNIIYINGGYPILRWQVENM